MLKYWWDNIPKHTDSAYGHYMALPLSLLTIAFCLIFLSLFFLQITGFFDVAPSSMTENAYESIKAS